MNRFFFRRKTEKPSPFLLFLVQGNFPTFPPVKVYFHICTESCFTLTKKSLSNCLRSPSSSSSVCREQSGRGAEGRQEARDLRCRAVIYPRGHGEWEVRRGPGVRSLRTSRRVARPACSLRACHHTSLLHIAAAKINQTHTPKERMNAHTRKQVLADIIARASVGQAVFAETNLREEEEIMLRSSCDAAAVGWERRP